MTYTFDAELWGDDGEMSWVFVSLPENIADDIADLGTKRGFGSVRVEVMVGADRWKTSVFPDSKRGTYVLPVKKSIRSAVGIEAGDTTRFALTVIETFEEPG